MTAQGIGGSADRSKAPRWQAYSLLVLKLLLATAFILAGGAKLAGVQEMITVFDHVGIGQWFRYVTGAIEIVGGVLVLIPTTAGPAALTLAVTMACAVAAHLTRVPGSPIPAIILLLLALIVAWTSREAISRLIGVTADVRSRM